MSVFVCFLVISFFLSVGLTWLLRRYARTRLLDHPNHRSSHLIPTPRGGGMAIVITFLLTVPLFASLEPMYLGVSDFNFALIWFASLAVALIGFTDDHISLKPTIRLTVQGVAAAIVVWAIDGLPVLTVVGYKFDLAWFGYLLAWLGVIWFINLYNFMDGIDGLAAGEAVVVCLGVALCHYLYNWASSPVGFILLLAVSVTGFLYWNFPLARIFMGDGGSGFIGFIFASLLLLDTALSPKFLWVWLVMLGVFVVDATWTLVNRYCLKCCLSEAHRTHAYQYAARMLQSHRKVTQIVILINIFWLTPIAVMIVIGYLDGFVGLCIAYMPLVYLAYRLNAGLPE